VFHTEDAELRSMQQQRYLQMVRSTMVLSLTELIARISMKQAFKKSGS
jgi:mannitol operon repressor